MARRPRCDNCEISIPHIEELHRLIAKILIDKSYRLAGEEVRFLRRVLGWSGSDFAKHMGVAEETVSRWEIDAALVGIWRLQVRRDAAPRVSMNKGPNIGRLRRATQPLGLNQLGGRTRSRVAEKGTDNDVERHR